MRVLFRAVARTKEFDEAEVLDQVVDLFRARGYQATSFNDLTSTLGVSRQSLYDTYGDKQTLFLAALTRYRERGFDHMRRLLDTPGPVRPLFDQLFRGAIEGSCAGGNHGCLMVNAMVEIAPHEPAIRALALTHARDVERLFAARLGAAQRAGDIPADKDTASLARYFYHTILGVGVAARALGERESLLATTRLALQALD